jgi:hypothetical protein
MADDRISAEDIEFDSEGRAIITNPQTVARLRGERATAEPVKNIGCCSVTDPTSETSDVAAIARAEPPVKNIGCCSVEDIPIEE